MSRHGRSIFRRHHSDKRFKMIHVFTRTARVRATRTSTKFRAMEEPFSFTFAQIMWHGCNSLLPNQLFPCRSITCLMEQIWELSCEQQMETLSRLFWLP